MSLRSLAGYPTTELLDVDTSKGKKHWRKGKKNVITRMTVLQAMTL
jgi:hypothetical protein